MTALAAGSGLRTDAPAGASPVPPLLSAVPAMMSTPAHLDACRLTPALLLQWAKVYPTAPAQDPDASLAPDGFSLNPLIAPVHWQGDYFADVVGMDTCVATPHSTTAEATRYEPQRSRMDGAIGVYRRLGYVRNVRIVTSAAGCKRRRIKWLLLPLRRRRSSDG